MAKFRLKPAIVDAIRIKKEITIDTSEGLVKGYAGDWLVTGSDGDQYLLVDSDFRNTHEPADDEAEKVFRRDP
jgi:hypothetical protein